VRRFNHTGKGGFEEFKSVLNDKRWFCISTLGTAATEEN
jgi:hypothetical protein